MFFVFVFVFLFVCFCLFFVKYVLWNTSGISRQSKIKRLDQSLIRLAVWSSGLCFRICICYKGTDRRSFAVLNMV